MKNDKPDADEYGEVSELFGITPEKARDIERLAMLAISFSGGEEKSTSFEAVTDMLKRMGIKKDDKPAMLAFLAGYSLHMMLGRMRDLKMIYTGSESK